MIEGTQETEVSAKAVRRQFSAKEKSRIVKEAAACSKPGEIGALLRREGIYSSHLSTWRRAAEKSTLKALGPKKRGPAPQVADQRNRKLVEAMRETARWRKRAERAEAIVGLQKKVSEILGIYLPDTEESP